MYGIKNRPSTPLKNIINYEYSNNAEDEIKRSYSLMINERSKIDKKFPKTRNYLEKILESKNREKSMKEVKKNKEMYKIKKFINVDSKVMENLKNFKTYLPNIFRSSLTKKDNIEDLILRVENDIKAIENIKVSIF